jgi:hypothetical protein
VPYSSQDDIWQDDRYLPSWRDVWEDDVRLEDHWTTTVDGVYKTNMLGKINGYIDITEDATTGGTLTTQDVQGQSYYYDNSSAVALTLPPVAAGMNACFYDLDGTADITIDLDGSDAFVLDGAAQTAGQTITSPGAAGDYICIEGLDDTYWVTKGRSGTWTSP